MEHKIAVMISGYISGAGDRSDLERIKILYGIEVFLNNFLKLCVLLILGFFGGILREVILVFLSFGFIREKAGGLHCRSNAACWILSMTLILGGGFLAKMDVLSFEWGYFLFFCSILLFYFYAPAGTKNHPVMEEECLCIKWKCMIMLVFCLVLSVLFWDHVGSTLCIGACLETVAILPCVDRLGEKI